ncbi:MAG: peptidylprolyl isomerase [Saprospiraceae bacterium]|nr:peptidylprolyl isomerase [Saprospiraceae bacterium]
MKYSKRISYTLLFFIVFSFFAFSQDLSKTLFTINNSPVSVDEFLYIYGKNNGKDADYSKKSLDEYLDLYQKFKLKVAKAKALKLDTLQDLREELHMYQQQVSNSYIMDKEVTDQLIKEIYERQKHDISVKHVFFQLAPNASPADTLSAYTRAMKAYEELAKGVPFGKVVMDNSDDRSNLNYSGDLGYVSAMLPEGFYNIENTIYALKIGEFSKPVRSSAGYHILRVDDIRPARREIEIAQILIKNPADPGSKDKAMQVYQQLKNGGDFKQLVGTYSEDANSKARDGYIGFIGINQFDKTFEDEVFSLKIDGDISKPIETRLGWHIIKRISQKEEEPYAIAKEKIKVLLESDSRYQYARSRVIDRIKSNNHFQVNDQNLKNFTDALPTDVASFSWEVSPELPDLELFRLGNTSYTSKPFAQYLKSNTQERLQYPNGTPGSVIVPAIFKSYINDKVIEFEQGNLSKSYPEFRNLMREYEEGILLFEITRQSVWDRASTDTVGLKAFYNKNKSAYMWNERAMVNEYTVKSNDEALVKTIYAYSGKKSQENLFKKFNKKQTLVTFEKDYLEKESEEMKSLSWTANFLTPFNIDKEKGITTWKKVEKILPPSQKTLEEARGYVIADYQDYLEKEWVAQLQKEYKVVVNQEVFDSLIKK